MKKINLVLLGFLLLILGVWFYWYEYRPSKIISSCYREIEDLPGEIELSTVSCPYGRECVVYEPKYDRQFRVCLNEHGIR